MEKVEEKLQVHEKISELASQHEKIKGEMLKIIDAIKLLDEQYHTLETQLYKVEDEYVELMKKL